MADLEVTLSHLYGQVQTPTGVVEEPVPDVWRVDVHSDALKDHPLRIAAGKLHVGMIGMKPGANFCENYNFSQFSPGQQKFIVEEVKRLHGSASKAEPVRLPEPMVIVDEDYEDDDDLEDTEIE